MRAVQNFKRLIDPTKEDPRMQSILGSEYETHFVQPPLMMEDEEEFPRPGVDFSGVNKSHSLDTYDRQLKERELVVQGYHQQPIVPEKTESPERGDNSSLSSRQEYISDDSRPRQGIKRRVPWPRENLSTESVSGEPTEYSCSASASQISRTGTPSTKQSMEGTRGHARDPLEEEHPFLFIGPSTFSGHHVEEHTDPPKGGIIIPYLERPDTSTTGILEFPNAMPPPDPSAVPIVSESPGAAEMDIYEAAYKAEIERIRKRRLRNRQGTQPRVYLTRRVEGKNVDLGELGADDAVPGTAGLILKKQSISSVKGGRSAITAQLASERNDQQAEEPSAEGSFISAEPESITESFTSEPDMLSNDPITRPETAFTGAIQGRRKNTLKNFFGRMRGIRQPDESGPGDQTRGP